MFKILQYTLLVLLSLSQIGCSSNAGIKAASMRRADLIGVSDIGVLYKLQPSEKLDVKGGLEYQSIVTQINQMLVANGFVPASDTGQEKHEITIEFYYAISGPIRNSYTYIGPSYMSNGSCACPSTQCVCVSETRPSGSKAIFGNELRTGASTVYKSNFQLTAWDSSEANKEQAWRTAAVYTGKNNNLRNVLPKLIEACKPIISSNTQ